MMRALVILLLAATVVLLGAVQEFPALIRGWLVACVSWLGLSLGAMLLLLVHAITGGDWGLAGRGVWLRLLACLPGILLAFVPLLFVLPLVFSWTEADLPTAVAKKQAYLNQEFFLFRAVLYGVVWWGLQSWLYRRPIISAGPAALGILLWLFSVTYFCWDWLLSLEPEFYSDVYSLMAGSAMVAAALAWTVMCGCTHSDIKRLWVVWSVAWALLAYSQTIVIWSANLPAEVGWYVRRNTLWWQSAELLAMALMLFLPLLLSQSRWSVYAGRGALLGYLLYVQVLILPAFGPVAPSSVLSAVLAVLLLGVCLCSALLPGGSQTRARQGEEGYAGH